jgi:hypothetical protein
MCVNANNAYLHYFGSSSGQQRELRGCGDINPLLEISGRGPLKIQREIPHNSRPSDHPTVYQSSLTIPYVMDTRKSINHIPSAPVSHKYTNVLSNQWRYNRTLDFLMS